MCGYSVEGNSFGRVACLNVATIIEQLFIGAPGRWHAEAQMAAEDKSSPLPKLYVSLEIFTRTAVLSVGFAVAIGAAAEATPLASDRDMVTGVSVAEADCRAQIGDQQSKRLPSVRNT